MNQEPLPRSPKATDHTLDCAMNLIEFLSAELKAARDKISDLSSSYVLACQDARETAQERDDYRRQRNGLQVALTKALEIIAQSATPES